MPGGQLGRDIHDDLADGDELLGDPATQAGSALDGPLAVGPLRSPGEQYDRCVLVHDESDRGMRLCVGFDRHGGQ